ncbi:MAG: LacI family DNA-binding transcriptional regulator [Saprospiraceae bacterium]|nr:LacI family DNA-binding transcriptional regulator [Saprospiraceae bacterium]
MEHKRITIYDIADRLGISPTTVSRALRGQQGIAKSTIKKVRSMADEMGYSLNTLAAGLRTRKSYNIGVVVPQIDRAFIATFISGIEEIANEAGFNVMIYQSMDDEAKEIRNVMSLMSSSVDGAIISLSMNTKSMDHIRLFKAKNIPLVMADRVADEMDVDKVVIDNFEAGYHATEYLISLGHDYIAHFAGSPERNVYRDRKDGYLAALKRYNKPINPQLLIYENLSEAAGVRAVEKLLILDQLPDAIFAANDTTAVSAVLHLQKLGIAIPDEISIVGFNNDPIASILKPQLTTVDHPAREIGKTAAKRLISRINADEEMDIQNETFTLKTSLIIRGSSGPVSIRSEGKVHW